MYIQNRNKYTYIHIHTTQIMSMPLSIATNSYPKPLIWHNVKIILWIIKGHDQHFDRTEHQRLSDGPGREIWSVGQTKTSINLSDGQVNFNTWKFNKLDIS